jgi:hypothetical protein
MTIIDAIGVGASAWRLMWLTRFTRRQNKSWDCVPVWFLIILDLITTIVIGGIVVMVLMHLGVHLT